MGVRKVTIEANGGKRVAAVVPILLLVGLITSCSSVSNPDVKSDYDKTVDFKSYQTYSWRQPINMFIDSFTQETFQITIDRKLPGRGLQKVPSDGDLELNVVVSLDQQMSLTGMPYAYWTGWTWGYWGVASQETTYYADEGTILIDLVDPSTEQLVWRAMANSILPYDRDVTVDEISNAVQILLNRYPPK